ncbi:hypothetical protein CEXT_122501 [Caerostris extrusa]|uniref:Uncharacterized protein n=1 Tax=Caerostris extrusa TaxID=172846 RepID=A0AAV4M9J7_CAEEX|nr:hypothetical protein CEXT_122501 [Caerostris extrusa]
MLSFACPVWNTQNRGATTAEPSHRLMQRMWKKIKRMAIVSFVSRIPEDSKRIFCSERSRTSLTIIRFKSFFG